MIGKGDLWTKNIVLDDSVSKFITENIFEYQENGKLHNPYAQEQREHDSIRRGDIEGLKASINEVYPGEIGKLAENQEYKKCCDSGYNLCFKVCHRGWIKCGESIFNG